MTTETLQHPLILTNPKPTDPRIERMAMAGFTAYYINRPYYTWANAVFAVRKRWQIMAERIIAGTITTAEELRDQYCEGMNGVPAFSGHHRLHWNAVLSAMRIAATEEAAA